QPVGLPHCLVYSRACLLPCDFPPLLEVLQRVGLVLILGLILLLIAIIEDDDLAFAALDAEDFTLGGIEAEFLEHLLAGLLAGLHVLDKVETALGARRLRSELLSLLEKLAGGIEFLLFEGHLTTREQSLDSDLVLLVGIGQGPVRRQQRGQVLARLPL